MRSSAAEAEAMPRTPRSRGAHGELLKCMGGFLLEVTFWDRNGFQNESPLKETC